jgi:hypothetical protein
MYFFPDSKLANGIGIFGAWEKSKGDPQVHAFVKYLVDWVAGTKLIFLLLLVVLLFTAGDRPLILTAIVMALSISVFFWRLYPAIRAMDQEGTIDPPGYSRTLALMIGGMILIFMITAVAAII